MKVITTAAAAALLTTAVNAADIGNGLSIGAELDTNWKYDAEALTMTLTPEMGYSNWGNEFTVSTDLDVYSAEEFQLGNAFDSMVLAILDILGFQNLAKVQLHAHAERTPEQTSLNVPSPFFATSLYL